MLITDIDKHRSDLVELWHEVFSDDEEYIHLIFDSNETGIRIFASFSSGKIVSALYAIPSFVIISGIRFEGLYVYACATYEAFRSRGLLSGLMNECIDFAREEGFSFLSLVPGERSLYDYYKRFGFETAMCRFKGRIESSSDEAEDEEIKEISFDDYFSLRKDCLCDYFEFCEKEKSYLEACLSFGNYKFFKGDDFAFVFEPDGEEITEFLSPSEDVSEKALERISSFLKLKSFVYYSPFGKVRCDFGMILPLSEEFGNDDLKNIYMNFALE